VKTSATGSFDVKLIPQPQDDEDKTRGRMLIDKEYHGGLEASGKGQMLTGLTDRKDSAGYVAIERVSGSLNGRRGSFLLQHTGTMSGGRQELAVTVVPDSGSGELKGISGHLMIAVGAGKHAYEFIYTLPDSD
jgi:Protein of unknown function (DUF3224)